ncbi:transcription factor A, mitochondrial isoform X2 [Dunckerocampus dactyliophorus]|uniref:transcription factor A, mitochondrial isoform X2 n=1 Tax=Dunckerocampus dactyliophorus TaxID=161453 RepID=UPI002404F853|nr:transcription factor A, mitochondrial isoform X2 [Dunckerocampus dactyliophorus]
MAPLSFVTASVSLLAKSFNVFTCTSTLARVVQAAYSNPVKCLCTQASGPPKRPLNGYMRYVVQQKPLIARQNPDLKLVVIVSKIAQAWRTMSREQKQPFEDAFLREKEQFEIDLKHYQAQLTPAEVQQQAIEKRQRMAKRKAIRKKRELTNMGKPKRPRSPFNIFMSEHYEEAKGTTTQAKMKSLFEDWKDLVSNQKQDGSDKHLPAHARPHCFRMKRVLQVPLRMTFLCTYLIDRSARKIMSHFPERHYIGGRKSWCIQ